MRNDFILKYEFEPKNEWVAFRKSIFFHSGAIISFIYFFVSKESIGLYLGFGLLFFIIPQLVLHFQYKLMDRNKKIIVNHSKQTIKIKNNGESEIQFDFKDIAKIIRYKGQKDEENTTLALPTFFYSYTKIILMNGQNIFFSDFLTKNIGLKNIEIVEKLSIFNLIK